MLKIKLEKILRILTFSLILVLVISFFKDGIISKNKSLNSINIYNPYKPIFPVNPAALQSVGDQVLCEHILGFHSRESITDGFQPVLSNVDFNHENQTVTVTPRFPVILADGTPLSNRNIFSSMKEVLGGSRHAPYGKLVQQVSFDDSKMTIQFSKIPVNLKYLFTLPDLSVFQHHRMPIRPEKNAHTSGPYFIDQVSDEKITLKRNPHYPKELIANSVEQVNLFHYHSTANEELIETAKPETHHLLYFFGHGVTTENLETLKKKDYKINLFPTEWLVYLGFSNRTDQRLRLKAAEAADEVRENPELLGPFGQKAYSLAPSNRPFGISEKDYLKTKPDSQPEERSICIGTLAHWSKIPSFEKIRDQLMKKFKNAKWVIYDRQDYLKMMQDCDISIRMLGLSPADPLSHLSFLIDTNQGLSNALSKEELADLSIESDFSRFSERVKKMEQVIHQKKIFIPMAHFSGIVASAPQFELDQKLSWSWGIQAWTYKVR